MFGTEHSVVVMCPTCGEPTAVWVDLIEAVRELEVESDCQVCCRPLHVRIVLQQGQVVSAQTERGW
jgi:hypothetical protein